MNKLDPPRIKLNEYKILSSLPPVVTKPLVWLAQQSSLKKRALFPLDGTGNSPSFVVALKSSSPLLKSFIVFVAAPSFALLLYFAFIAANQYSSETRFTVRLMEAEKSDKNDGSSSSSAANSGFAFTAANQNAYIVTSYIRSRGIIDDIGSEVNLREIFRRPEADVWARLKKNASIDELSEYWNEMVESAVDTMSGIVTVHVKAFRPEDALAIGAVIVKKSEALVNRLSDRARIEATQKAESEVRRAFVKVQSALADMQAYQNSASMLDPKQATNEITALLIPLMMEKIRIENEIFVIAREVSADAPSIRILKNQLASNTEQIAALQQKLTGSKNSPISSSLGKFQELELQRQLAEKFYALAQADLERARLRANRQEIFFSVFVKPSLPEHSNYPHRVTFTILSFLGLCVLWGIVVMTLASIDDHRI